MSTEVKSQIDGLPSLDTTTKIELTEEEDIDIETFLARERAALAVGLSPRGNMPIFDPDLFREIQKLPAKFKEEKTLLLSQRYPHPNDREVYFADDGHEYRVWNSKTKKFDADYTSVTTFIKQFHHDFNVDENIETNFPKWCKDPDSKYHGMSKEQIKNLWKVNNADSSAKGTKLHRQIELFINNEGARGLEAPICPPITEFDKGGASTPASPEKKTKGSGKRTSDGCVKESVKRITSSSRTKGTKGTKGTTEGGLGGETKSPPPIEWMYVRNFWRTEVLAKNWLPYRTEFRIVSRKHKIVGTIDMLFVPNPSRPREIIIYDWKRSKGIEEKAISYGSQPKRMMADPLSGLDDCNFNHYNLQVNTYRSMLEDPDEGYNFVVVGMFLGVFHPFNERGDYESWSMNPDFIKYIDMMMAHRAKHRSASSSASVAETASIKTH
jgi:hypothetical protein